MKKKLPPQNNQLERSVLSCLLQSPGKISEVKLDEDCFYETSHQVIFSKMMEIYKKKGMFDMMILHSRLNEDDEAKKKILGKKSGQVSNTEYAFLDVLEDMGRYEITATNLHRYEEELIKLKSQRNLKQLALEIENNPDIDKAREKFREFERSLVEIKDPKNATELLDDYGNQWKEKIEKKKKGETIGIPTGFPTLDRDVCIERGQLITLAAKTSIGKSALAVNIGVNSAKTKFKVLFFSLEMTETKIMDRIFSMNTGVDNTVFKYANAVDEDKKKGVSAIKELEKQFKLIYMPRCTTLDVMSSVAREKSKDGLDLVIVDYLQILSDPQKKNETNAQRIGNMTANLKAMAGEHDVAVIILSQFNRGSSFTKMPTLDQLRDSGTIEQDSDVVMILNREDRDAVKGVLRIAKSRNGKVFDIDLEFSPKTTTYRESKKTTITTRDITQSGI